MKCEIILYTLDDCEGCKILRKNVNEVIQKNTTLEITVNEINSTGSEKKVLRQLSPYKVYDFPAMLFIKNGIITLADSGSRPVTVLQRYIDLYFKK